MRINRFAAPLGLAAFLLSLPATSQQASSPSGAPPFALQDGDRVTFYGDSITEQRLYTADVEAYVLTRFPDRKISFHNAGVGGDKVSGGWAGPIDLRLQRDVYAWHPNVVTVMLGMNDFYYRAERPGVFSSYQRGYRELVEALHATLPAARITLIQPSPYDDVTRDPEFAGGSNAILKRYGAFVAELAGQKGFAVTDFNAPVVAALQTLKSSAPGLAQQLIPDRVHPSDAGHWVMAESLLKTWHAPSIVTSVEIDAATAQVVVAENSAVSGLVRGKTKTPGSLSWTQKDRALPLPLTAAPLDPVLEQVVANTDLIAALDQEILRVRGLGPGTYLLVIDESSVGSFTAAQLAAGINLATMETPMLAQARAVAADTERINALEASRFTLIAERGASEDSPTVKALAEAYPRAVERQRTDAQPRSHSYSLTLRP